MQSDKMAILQNEIEKYDEDDEVPGTGVGESAVLRREHLYAVKRAVQYAVSVNNKKVHVQPPSFESKILYYTTQAAICILFYILFPFI